jgi:integrase
MNAMIDVLRNSGRLDLLLAIRDGALTPLEVYSAFRLNDLSQLPTADLMKPFPAAMTRWREGYPCSAHHRKSLAISEAGLARFAHSRTTVADAPRILSGYRHHCERTGHHRSFNLARSALQAFFRSTLGRHHRLWLEVASIQKLPEKPKPGRPISPEQVRNLVTRLGHPYGAMAWSMAISGMGPGEYWDRWEMRRDRVAIHGTKREGRDRVVPLVGPILPPPIGYQAFRKRLAKVSDGKTRPYDFRRCFAHWMEEAGVPRTRRRLYLGHGAKDVTDLYEVHDVTAFLAEDAARLGEYLDETVAGRIRLLGS